MNRLASCVPGVLVLLPKMVLGGRTGRVAAASTRTITTTGFCDLARIFWRYVPAVEISRFVETCTYTPTGNRQLSQQPDAEIFDFSAEADELC